MTCKPLLFCSAFMAMAVSTFSQQRVCDMGVLLVSPANGATLNANAQYNISVAITNNGPSDLLAGDTVYYNTPMIPSFSLKPYVLQQGITSGSTATIVLESANNNNTNTIDVTEAYCVKVLGNSLHSGAFIDTANLTNNISCNQVTLKAANPTALNDVITITERLTFYPNPAISKVFIEFDAYKPQDVTIIVRDVTGRAVVQKEYPKAAVARGYDIDIAILQNGLYLLELRTADRKAIGKLVKQ